MVRHQPLQYYEPQLCLSCLTGIYGCRWKRYQRSHDDTTPWERLWFLLLTVTFGLTLTWLYFWWEVHNDYNEFNWYLYNRLGYWSDWSVPILMTAATAFTYIAGLLVLALCHIAVGQQMNLHWLHKMGLVVILVSTVVAMSAMAQLWEDEWEVLLISLQGTAPFLHMGALAAITALSWIVAGQFARAERSSSQMAILCTFSAVVFALYLAPLTISSPCIMEKKDLGPKPALIGHRGVPMLAPEHTLMSFRKALEHKLYGLQADVTISLDGVPFLMHDTTLRRTTNVEEAFPELAHRPASMLNWTVLQRLNAGQWFLKTDPFWTASSLSPSDHREAQNQSICSLAELLALAKGNATLLLNLHDPPRDHPYRASFLNITLEALLRSGFPQHQTDPFWTASSLSPSDHREAQNQSICSLAELLALAKGNATLLLNLHDPPRDHPYRASFLNITLEALLRSGFPQHQVMWLPNRQRPFVRKVAPGFQQTSGSKEEATSLHRGHIQWLNLRYTQVSRPELRDYASWNLSVNLYTVNTPWLFSLLWCMGVPSVTSDNSHTLSQVPFPLWIMPPDEYCLMWVTADLISFTLIVGIFVLQNYHLIRWRLGGIRSYNPEQIMLNAAVHRTSRDVSIMKEKLIFSEISDGMEVSDELSVCSDNSYDTYANSASTPVDPRGAGGHTKTLADRSGR
ncbi:Glycerophosphodiester phosphodiesterase domain-containing protein 5 [Myotis brandtii]|uniref:Glycerophosphodiester phosphodiesterase domain-containing protein 5 n=1 Tax=Myotis brandtii TaxID=109478 RepID=S7MV32_MYOBR|nr:Glycerophosphodiester phosphodiesterase domain-containing protein 5 [Myotis brandtii]